MASFLLSVVVLLAFLIATFGWGHLLCRLIYGEAEVRVAYAVALGMATWIVLGGALNLLGLAFPITLYAMYAAGTVLASRKSTS